MPRSLLWTSAGPSEYSGVRVYAQRIKDAILAAHDAILASRVKQIKSANHRRRPAPFSEGDFVYLSTANLRLPKARARKLIPKFIGPYKILKDFGNSSFRLELPPDLRSRGIHDVFHASLLRIHNPNDDRRFPGRQLHQIAPLHGSTPAAEWDVSCIQAHSGTGKDAMFLLRWAAGDTSWLPFHEVSHLTALSQYLEALGIDSIKKLPLSLASHGPDGLAANPSDINLEGVQDKRQPTLSSSSSAGAPPTAPTLSLSALTTRPSSHSLSCSNVVMPAPQPPTQTTAHAGDRGAQQRLLITETLPGSPPLQLGIYASTPSPRLDSPAYMPQSPGQTPPSGNHPASPIMLDHTPSPPPIQHRPATQVRHTDMPPPPYHHAPMIQQPQPTVLLSAARIGFPAASEHTHTHDPRRHQGHGHHVAQATAQRPPTPHPIATALAFLGFIHHHSGMQIDNLRQAYPELYAQAINYPQPVQVPQAEHHRDMDQYYQQQYPDWQSTQRATRGRAHRKATHPICSNHTLGCPPHRHNRGPGSSGGSSMAY